jgi:hypothetical protein
VESEICTRLRIHFPKEIFWIVIDGTKRELFLNRERVGITWELTEYPPQKDYEAVLTSFIDQLIPNIANFLALTSGVTD